MSWRVVCDACKKEAEATVANGKHVKPSSWLQCRSEDGAVILDVCSPACAQRLDEEIRKKEA